MSDALSNAHIICSSPKVKKTEDKYPEITVDDLDRIFGYENDFSEVLPVLNEQKASVIPPAYIIPPQSVIPPPSVIPPVFSVSNQMNVEAPQIMNIPDYRNMYMHNCTVHFHYTAN